MICIRKKDLKIVCTSTNEKNEIIREILLCQFLESIEMVAVKGTLHCNARFTKVPLKPLSDQ